MMTHHHHEHPQQPELDWDTQRGRLEQEGELYQPAVEQAAAWLRDLRGPTPITRILDIGSGPGVATTVLAHAFPEAEVVAVDGAAALLQAATARAERLGLGQRVRTLQASLPEDAARLPEADLIWASNALHHVGDQQAAIALLERCLRRGGWLAVAEGGLPARFLPSDMGIGRPGLQARLDAAQEELFATMRAALPEARPGADWPGMLRASGLAAVASRTFLVDVPPPLPANGRAFLRANLAAQRDRLAERLDATDLDSIARLLDDHGPASLLRRPDVFFLAARTVHAGRSG